MKKFFACLLLFCLALSLCCVPAYGDFDFPFFGDPETGSGTKTGAADGLYDPTVKIGLYYDSNALAAANLQNVSGTGTGYALGYYDHSRSFVETFRVEDENQITVLKNDNLWLSGSAYSDTELPMAKAVGAHCLQVDAFYTLDEALEVIDAFARAGYDAYPCAVSRGFRVRLGQYTSAEQAKDQLDAAEAAAGYPLVYRGPSSTGYTVVITGTDQILYQLDLLGEHPLGIRPLSEKTWFKNQTYYGGFEYNRVSGGDLNVINVVGMTNYIKGVVPYEVNAAWPAEAIKVQALCAKCYTLNTLGKHRSKGFDLCNTTDCQVYYGTRKATDASDAAVEAVNGLYVLYEGKVCQTYYHATSGGYTEDVENIWNSAIPYLRAVEDTYLEVFSPYSNTVTLDDVTWVLQNKGLIRSNQRVKDFYGTYTKVGNCVGITFLLSDGTVYEAKKDKARTVLNSSAGGITVNSHRFTITGGSGGTTVSVNGASVSAGSLWAVGGSEKVSSVSVGGAYAITGSGLQQVETQQQQQDTSGVYVIAGTGMGHNIGMSQWGAYAMAQKGFTAEEIIRFYYTGVTVDYYDPN